MIFFRTTPFCLYQLMTPPINRKALCSTFFGSGNYSTYMHTAPFAFSHQLQEETIPSRHPRWLGGILHFLFVRAFSYRPIHACTIFRALSTSKSRRPQTGQSASGPGYLARHFAFRCSEETLDLISDNFRWVGAIDQLWKRSSPTPPKSTGGKKHEQGGRYFQGTRPEFSRRYLGRNLGGPGTGGKCRHNSRYREPPKAVPPKNHSPASRRKRTA